MDKLRKERANRLGELISNQNSAATLSPKRIVCRCRFFVRSLKNEKEGKKMKKIIGCLVIFIALTVQPIIGEAKDFYPKIFADIAREANKSVVIVFGGADLFLETPIFMGHGAGFFVDKNLIITANHIITKTAAGLIEGGTGKSPEFAVKLFTGEILKAMVLKQYSAIDIAILSLVVEGNIATPLPLKLGDSSKGEVGDIVMAIGHPRSLFWSLTVGVISGLRKADKSEFLQTDAAVNPGNSGGPLLNLDSEVIGVILMMVGEADGLNLALSINVVRKLIQDFQSSAGP